MTGAAHSCVIGVEDAWQSEYQIPPAYESKIRVPDNRPIMQRTYFASDAEGVGPEAYLVEVPSPSETAAHFHDVDQFQVFFGGNGAWYQRHDIGNFTLHYSDAYTTYGPFGCRGAEPLRYFTLRQFAARLAGFPPGDRPTRAGRRRNIEADVPAGVAVPEGRIDERTVIAEEPDGLAAELLSAGPKTQFTVPSPDQENAGAYCCVLGGSVRVGDSTYGPQSLAWLEPHLPSPAFVAGGSGVQLLRLQFPRI